MLFITSDIKMLIDKALSEDLSLGDPTTDSLLTKNLTGHAEIVAKEDGILAGITVAIEVLNRVDSSLRTHVLIEDGSHIKTRDIICSIEGSIVSILRAERTALNFLQRMSGIATETLQYVLAIKGLKARIVDTRKTVPGLRTLDKYAVRMGGGYNHRFNLGDGILIKDNHLEAMRKTNVSLKETIHIARQNTPHTLKIEVEVENLDQVSEALDANVELIMLDNMNLKQMAAATQMAKGRALVEASGGVNLKTVRSVAETGVDIISVGALTHSVKSLDLSLDLT